MTDNNQTPTSTSKEEPEPKYRKKLNQEQVAVLQMLYRFRFASSEQIARFQEKPNSKAIQKRLKILEDQRLVAKRYDKSYKLKGKPAAYYLLPKGARAFEINIPRRPGEPLNMKRLYKEKDVSEGFIQHCLNVLSVYLALKALYPAQGKLGYFTKSQLGYEKYEFFPSPLQDAYIHIKTGTSDKHFFLDIFEDTQPFFVLIRRIKKYLDYAGSGDWEANRHRDLPTILLVVQNKSVHKRLRKRIAYELRESYEEPKFATTMLEHLLDLEQKGKVWLPIDEEGDDVEEPIKAVALTNLPETNE